MTFQKPKSNPAEKPMQLSSKDMKKVTEVLVTNAMEKNETKRKTLDKVDDIISKMLNAFINYHYYLLSLTTACIGFAISITVHQKFVWSDSLIIVSVCSWMVSLTLGINTVIDKISMMSNHSFYIQAEMLNLTDMARETKKAFEAVIEQNKKLYKNPLLYLTIGVFVFMIWYLIKIFNS